MKRKSIIKSELLIKQKSLQIALGASKVFKKKGYYKATVREIAEASNLTIGNLYDYVENKEDILALVFKEFHNLWVEAFNRENIFQITDAVQQMKTAIHVMFQMAEQMRDMAFLMYTETKSLPKRHLKIILSKESELIHQFTKIVQNGIEQGVFECEDPELLGSLILYQLNFKILRGWSIKKEYSAEDVLNYITDFVLRAISTTRTNPVVSVKNSSRDEEG